MARHKPREQDASELERPERTEHADQLAGIVPHGEQLSAHSHAEPHEWRRAAVTATATATGVGVSGGRSQREHLEEGVRGCRNPDRESEASAHGLGHDASVLAQSLLEGAESTDHA